jgi:hypothetical protein
VLLVVGNFSLRNNLIRDIHINLYLNEKRIDSLIVSGSQEFGFYLKRDSKFIIEITKDGFIRKTIGVSTELPDDLKIKSYLTFGFIVPLVKKQEEDEDEYVKYISDLPIAFIFYNEQIKKFDSGRDYTKALKEKYNNARQEAKKLK